MASGSYSSQHDIDKAVKTLRATFRSGRSKDVNFRKWQLKQLYWLVGDSHQAFIDALYKDLGRPEFETRLGLKAMQDDIVYHIKHVVKWARGETPKSGFLFTSVGRTHLRAEPRGSFSLLVRGISPTALPYALLRQPSLLDAPLSSSHLNLPATLRTYLCNWRPNTWILNLSP